MKERRGGGGGDERAAREREKDVEEMIEERGAWR